MLASICLDDGTKDQYDKAVPILEEYGINATWSLCHDLIGGAWRYGSPGTNLIDWNEVEVIKKRGDEIADHTPNHISPLETDDPILLEKEYTANPFNATTFIYPRGEVCLKDKIREVYQCARSCRPGAIKRGEEFDPYDLPIAYPNELRIDMDGDWGIFYYHHDVDVSLPPLLKLFEKEGVEIMVIKDALQAIL